MIEEGEKCPNCGGELTRVGLKEAECVSCGSIVEVRYHTPFARVEEEKKPNTQTQITRNIANGEGEEVKNKQPPVTSKGTIVTGRKSMGVAIFLGIILVGLGYLYAGKMTGLIYFIAAILLCWTIVVPIVLWILGLVQAYNLVEENNRLWEEYQRS